MISLCSICNSRFQKEFPEGPCHICENQLDNLNQLLQNAESTIPAEWNTFAISTSIPKKTLAKEEEAWDQSEGECLKNWLNARLSQHLEKSTGKTYSPMNADGRISTNFSTLEATASNEPLFIFGRYKKLVRGICQSKWLCLRCNGSGCRHCNGKGKMYDESVEELIGDAALTQTRGKYELHASGREDIDVLNFAGRPFILQIKNPTTISINLGKLTEEINSQKKLELTDLKLVPPGSVSLVADSHFPKTYRAWIASDQPLLEEDSQKLNEFSFTLNQRTPERVAHRRADKIRHRHAQVLKAKLENSQIVADIKADPGTYIKELIHGDKGRTDPSISSFLNKPCTCARLDVIEIEDDFLTFILS
ncbi:tRNA pseudouridine(54/55) synthase Pus10 [Candidatus Micrarchaeota archaeon]|nr:tRNA pseudouridine(54/55) synthase Pus10 [Candidatus Micrarchaeota archaeon]MBD3417783.1 tRNA pseudouridine(54/55) synthase Pus10 [Candidatus Micrarchaeota archaeon]